MFKKNYFWCLLIAGTEKSNSENIVKVGLTRDYKKIIDIGKKEDTKLLKVFSPQYNYFKSINGEESAALIYGYQREWNITIHAKGKKIHNEIMKVFLKSINKMRSKVQGGFALYAFGFAEKLFSSDDDKEDYDDEEFDYDWTLLNLNMNVPSEKIYSVYPREHLFYNLNKTQDLFPLDGVDMTCPNCSYALGSISDSTPMRCPYCKSVLTGVNMDEDAVMKSIYSAHEGKKKRVEKINGQNAEQWFRKGAIALISKNYQKMISCMENTLEINPKFEGAWSSMALAYQSLGNFKIAIECGENEVMTYPKSKESWDNLAFCYREIGNEDKKIECLEKVVELDPNDWKALFILGQSFLNKDEDKSVEYGTRAIRAAYNKLSDDELKSLGLK